MILEEILKIMTWVEVVIKACSILIGIAIACAVTIPTLIKAIKQRKAAKTSEEKLAADLAIKNAIFDFVVQAETNYANLDTALKQLGESAGALKKESVMSEIRDYCDKQGYTYDKQAISNEVDNVVAFTKTVNYIKK